MPDALPSLVSPETAYAAIAGRDARWDGRLYLGVSTTGIYCRPSCPARTPRPENCQFFPTAAAAAAAGFRACRRCRPDALPGSRDWDVRADLAARAVRLIAGGAMDDGGLSALASRLAVSPRHLTRLVVAEVGATPGQLARTRRAHTARLLLAQTDLPLADVALAAGFGSVRQFNAIMKEEFGATPSALRTTAQRASRAAVRPRAARPGVTAWSGVTTWSGETERAEGVRPPSLTLRLAYRPPLALGPLRRTLAAHVVDGVERVDPDGTHVRVVAAPGGPAVVRLHLGTAGAGEAHDGDAGSASTASGPWTSTGAPATLPASVDLTDLRDLMPVLAATRRWLDLDADPLQIHAHLGEDPMLAPLLMANPGLRVPGAVDGAELAVCAVLGQQVSLAVARTFQGRIARAFGAPLPGSFGAGSASLDPLGEAGHATVAPLTAFPSPATLAEAGPQRIRDAAHLTQARARAVHGLAVALANGEVTLEPGVDPAETRTRLLALPGIGPWTADYIALRALRDPDAFMPSDLVLRKALAARTDRELREVTPSFAECVSAPWRPWRSYALQHLWTHAVYDPPPFALSTPHPQTSPTPTEPT